MQTDTVRSSDIAQGDKKLCAWFHLHERPARHDLHAEWVEGRGCVITAPDGTEVKASFGATADARTVYAHVEGMGFIGGWTYPHRKMAFRKLVGSINRGIVCQNMDDLSNGRSQ